MYAIFLSNQTPQGKYNIQMKIIRGDNAGKNKELETTCKQEGLGVSFEYTSPGTPQQKVAWKGNYHSL